MPAIPKIYAAGHKHNSGILQGVVAIEEKVDGSQFSFTSWPGGPGAIGVLECRSKGTILSKDAGMFKHACDTAAQLYESGCLQEGWQYQCEYLAKPKHNVLNYACIPAGHLVLFDVRRADGSYEWPGNLPEIAEKLGISAVPVLFLGDAEQLSPERLQELLRTKSFLGGCEIEGIVIKNYGKPHPESQSGKAPRTATIVNDAFKEKHASGPINGKAAKDAVAQVIINRYRTEARWLKAIQHLKEAGKLANGPEDIGPLLAEIHTDLLAEEQDEIKQALFDAFWKQIAHGVASGFPQYYKKLLCGGPSIWQDTQINSKNENSNV